MAEAKCGGNSVKFGLSTIHRNLFFS